MSLSPEAICSHTFKFSCISWSWESASNLKLENRNSARRLLQTGQCFSVICFRSNGAAAPNFTYSES
ncbi:unnamed protein product [Linum trigynum]|uniref:Uncharacterized protein n=1 Tax=Linum trigynum TaxID=586398 RepID=A0AAV2D5W2_9ROSI